MLKGIAKAFELQALDRSLGLESPSLSSLREVYERFKKKFPGPEDEGWLDSMKEMIEEQAMLESSGYGSERRLQ